MHLALFFLQSTIWITGTQAFFPFFPEVASVDVESRQKRVAEAEGLDDRAIGSKGFVTFKLSPKTSGCDEPVTNKATRIAHDLAKKYSSELPSRTLPEDSTLVNRENKYSIVEAEDPTQSKSAGIDQDGTDFSYFVEAALGSSATPMYMLLDTGASTSWVMASGCTSSACMKHKTFGTEDSNTIEDLGQSFSVEYGSGSVSGKVVSDTVEIGGLKANMPFGLANKTSEDFTQFPFDGILGLSKSSSGPQNFLEALKAAKVISANVFGISLSRSSDGMNDGEISFGAPNPAKYTGDISYVTTDSKAGNWAVPLDNVTVDGKSAVTDAVAYIDTGTTYVFGPPKDVEALFKAIPDASSSDNGVTWTVPCDSDATVAFTFSGKSYDVSSKDFRSSSSTDNRCSCNIFGIEVVSGTWLLGDVLLKNVYAVFDQDQARIGFASKAKTDVSSTVSTSVAPVITTIVTTISGSATTMTTISSSITVGTAAYETTTGSIATSTATASAAGMQSPGRRIEAGGFYVSIVSILSITAMIA